MFLKSIDKFGIPVEFNINGQGSVNTKLGGCITLFIYGCTLALLIGSYYTYFQEFSPNISYEFSTLDFNSSSTYNADVFNITYFLGEVMNPLVPNAASTLNPPNLIPLYLHDLNSVVKTNGYGNINLESLGNIFFMNIKVIVIKINY